VLGGLLATPTVQEVYDKFTNGKPEAFSRWDVQEKLGWLCDQEEEIDRVVTEMPTWSGHASPSAQMWGNPGWGQSLEWFYYIRMAVDAGYYGIASVVYDKSGPPAESDHVVLICGAREREAPHPTVKTARTIEQEVLVSCSAAHPQGKWVCKEEFLTKWGGFYVTLARPD
jgi:hypothetical protein